LQAKLAARLIGLRPVEGLLFTGSESHLIGGRLKRQYGYEKLEVWHDSRQLVKDVYLLTKKIPESERYGLISQIQRSAVSVSSNIAEGSSRVSCKDQAHFYQTAYASLMELLCQMTLCIDINYLTENEYKTIRDKIDKVAYRLNALRKAALQNEQNKTTRK